MSVEQISFNTLAVALLESADRLVKAAIDGLSEEQLYFQPSPDAPCACAIAGTPATAASRTRPLRNERTCAMFGK